MKLLIVALVVSAAQMNAFAFSTMKIPLNKRSSLAVDGVVDTESLQAHLAHAESKYESGFAAYKQNTGQDHPSANKGHAHTHQHAHNRRATGVVPLTIKGGGTVWQGSIFVGTPQQTFVMDFDTGSSDLILPGPNCTTCTGHAMYNPTTSTTSHDLGLPFTIKYGDGSVLAGEQFSDNVQAASLIATNQNIGAANAFPPGLQIPKFPPDGIVGMGFQTLSVSNSAPFFQNLISQGQVTQPVFGFKLSSMTGSELFLGGTNPALFAPPLTYIPITTPAYWQIPLDGVTVNGVPVGGAHQSIIDTGTTLIIGDPITVAGIYAQIPGSLSLAANPAFGPGFYSFPCVEASFISITLTFGGVEFAIDPMVFNIGQVARLSTHCVGGIMASATAPFWVIGDVFLQGVYTAFDVGQTRVGFAKLA